MNFTLRAAPPTPIPSPRGGGEPQAPPAGHAPRRWKSDASLPACGGGMGWGGLLPIFATLIPAPAWAEVCDKVVGDNWVPVGFVNELLLSVQSVSILVPIGVLLALVAAGSHALFALSIFPLFAFWFLHPQPDPDWQIMQAARKEGCVGPLFATLLPYLTLSGAMLFRAAMLHRARTTP